MMQIGLTVNEKKYSLEGGENLSLLDYLRGHLGLMGAKNGCGRGHCGTCTVIANGRAKRSCTVKMKDLAGARVETIENLSRGGILHPLQEAFIRTGAVQCGFCTPGMIMAAKALLDADPKPERWEIKEALQHNLCRCTGYQAIIQAVEWAGAVLRGEKSFPEVSPAGGAGCSVLRKDGIPKVCGMPLFTDDMEKLPGMLYGKLLLSPCPHGEILSIDTSEALKSPGVAAVCTARDIPGRNAFGLITPNQPVLADKKVLYVGDPVAVVYADSMQAAAAACSLIHVEYRELPGVFSPKEAKAQGAPLLHPQGNVISCTKVRRGDTDIGFREADVVIEEEYSVPFVEHAYMEPESALTKMDAGGVLTLWTSSQGAYAFRDMLAASLVLPPEKVRVICNPAGGAFGGKEEPTVQIHCALGTLKTGRPVKMTLTREESIRMSTKRHAEKMRYKLGATKEGRLVAFEADVTVDTGAYDSLGKPVVFRSGVVTAGPYKIPNVRIDSTGFYTNNPPGGAFRGFGSTQVAFAAEVQMDILARTLGIDPFQIREINGLISGSETITGQTLGPGVGYLETLHAVKAALEKEKERFKPSSGKKIGIGIASAYKNVGIGAGKSDKAGAILELNRDGEIRLKVGAAELGQGSDTVLAQLVTEAAGIPFDMIRVINNDTFETPSGEVTTASRQTFISGNAVLGASAQFIENLKRILRDEMSWPEGPICFTLEMISGPHGRSISWQDLGELLRGKNIVLRGEAQYLAPRTYPLPERNHRLPGDDPHSFDIHFAYVFGTQAAIVEVDEKTGRVRVLKIIAAADVGRAINPQLIKNQVEGAVVMGLGYALSEEFIMEKGQVKTDTLARLGLPKITDAPEIEVITIEKEQPDGPYGAKGMGELPINPTAPAIINAIYDALGVRIRTLPARL